ncbi:Acyl-CoA dehydrogenase, C-termina, bacterial type [Phytophthora cactorum]|nr:Acyl-CoA dehydrogenase, C-termina, bacterial type [Phytophthora cactorum]
MLSPALLKSSTRLGGLRLVTARSALPAVQVLHQHQSRTFVAQQVYKLAKRVMPRMSNTEKAALESGTLNAEEQAFMDNEDMPLKVWQFIKDKGFLGMIIPKEYGGKQFSAHGHSVVITKIATRSATAAVTVCVPNSLGPAELLLRYGTDEQKNHFLPGLANGKHLPCFGLTGPRLARMRPQCATLALCASRTRYITLAPVATCVGLAVDVKDPQGLLKGKGNPGITVALLERNHPGLQMGKRHDTISIPFMNGPVTGQDVFIPMSKIIGGQERVGYGWNMLMDCLAEGRSISLPASAVAGAKLSVNAVGAYARIRKQFKVPIASLEGIQEQLATMGSNAFIMTSGQHMVNAMINQHEQPAVISGVCKQQITDRGRDTVIRAMDVLGGAGICKGPNNFLANIYTSLPVVITVEGANILTRSLIIFGQGLTRAHPHLYELIKTIQHGDDIDGFKKELVKLVKHGASNTAGSLKTAATRSRFKKQSGLLAHYESQMDKLAKNFAMSADLSLVLGGKLKFAEMISGRFADVFSSLYLGYSTMWFYKNNRHIDGIDVIFDYAMTQLCHEAQQGIVGISKNFPVPGVGPLMRGLSFPFGLPYDAPTDKQMRQVSELISTDSAVRNLLSDNVFVSNDPEDRVALLNATLPKAVKADRTLTALRKQKRSATIDEQKFIDEVEAAREIIIQVDNFDGLGAEIGKPKDYERPGMIGNIFDKKN